MEVRVLPGALRFSLLLLLLSLAEARAAQSPRAANHERPTVATHAYAVARGAGLSAGRTLGALVGVVSVNITPAWHVDLNLGPTGIGAEKPQWFGSTGVTWSRGAAALTTELFGFTAGGSGPRQRGVLVAVLTTLGESVVADAGGVWGATSGTPDQLFVGLTTNLGRLFE